MHPTQSHRLKPGTPVWIWLVRLGRGRWWPGTVEAMQVRESKLRVAVRFECRPTSGRDQAPVMAGITTTAMRYLEFRDIRINGMDQPRHTPVSLLEHPEELELAVSQETSLGEQFGARESQQSLNPAPIRPESNGNGSRRQ